MGEYFKAGGLTLFHLFPNTNICDSYSKIQQSKNRFFAVLLQFNESNKFAKTNITIAVSYGGIKNV